MQSDLFDLRASKTHAGGGSRVNHTCAYIYTYIPVYSCVNAAADDIKYIQGRKVGWSCSGVHSVVWWYSKWGLTIVLYSGIISYFSLYTIFCLINQRIWFAFAAAIPYCSDTFMSALIVNPKSFSFNVVFIYRTDLIVNFLFTSNIRIQTIFCHVLY